jgi:single-strand DNA-binding protein
MAASVNRVVLTGNLTRDPELRSTNNGTSVCALRVAVNTRRKDANTGEWVDKAGYFDVTVWGAQGENCAAYLERGRGVAVDGRLDWREWETDDGSKRQAVSIVAQQVQFLGSQRPDADNGGQREAPASDVPADSAGLPAGQPQPATLAGRDDEDDIPFSGTPQPSPARPRPRRP